MPKNLHITMSHGLGAVSMSVVRFLSGTVLALMVLSISYDTLARYLFGRPTNWSLEVNGFFVLYLGTVGAIDALSRHQHIRLTMFSAMLPLRARRLLHQCLSLVGAVFCIIIAWRGVLLAHDAFEYNERVSSALGTPMFIPYALLPIAFGIMALQFLQFTFGSTVADDDL